MMKTFENDVIEQYFPKGLKKEEAISFLESLFKYEKELSKYQMNKICLKVDKVDSDVLKEMFSYALKYEDLCDASFIFNIIPMIRLPESSLSEDILNSPHFFFKDEEEFNRVKGALKEDLKAFTKQLSIYFISLFKSYNKVIFTALDTVKELPNLYKNVMLSMDFLSLSAMFARTEPFSTLECIHLYNAFSYAVQILAKTPCCEEFKDILVPKSKE